MLAGGGCDRPPSLCLRVTVVGHPLRYTLRQRATMIEATYASVTFILDISAEEAA
jgi:hypothetical protein